MKRITGVLTLLALITITSSEAMSQFCSLKRHFPNYMASVDGYAPADYDGDGLADWSIKDFSGAWTIDFSANGLNGYDVTSTVTVARAIYRFPTITMVMDSPTLQ